MLRFALRNLGRCRQLINIAIVSALLTGCQQSYQVVPQKIAPPVTPMVSLPSEQPQVHPSQLRIALLLPLTGERKEVGTHLANAAQLAFLKVPAPDVQLLSFDTMGTTDGALQALAQAQQAQAHVIIGPLTAAETRAIQSTQILPLPPVLSFSNDRSVAKDGIFVLGIQPHDQVGRIVAHMKEQGTSRLLVLAPQNAFGEDVQRAALSWAQNYQLPAPRVVFYTSAETVESVIHSLPVDAYDAILLPENGFTLQSIAAYLTARNGLLPHKTCYGLDSWRVMPPQDSQLRGCYFAGLPSERLHGFQETYQATFGMMPHPLAGLAYDAVNLVKVLHKQGQLISSSTLTSPTGFLGVYGPVRFKGDGTSERRLALYTLQGSGPHVIIPAASDFSATTQTSEMAPR